MNDRPISVVIPNYNRAATIRACVESVLDTIRDRKCEVIVVDDGSTDRSIESLQRIKGIKLIRQKHQGAARALNNGFAAAGRNDVIRMHSDVMVETTDWLDQFLHALASQPKAGVIGATLVYPDHRIYALGRNIVSGFGWHERHRDCMAFVPDSSQAGPVHEVDSVPGAFAYYRREVLDATGGLDENYTPGWTDDDDFCIAARVHGYKVVVQPAAKAIHLARAWSPTSGIFFHDQLDRVRRLTWELKYNIRKIHAAYWETKWGWNPVYPDLTEIRRLYGHTELCWRIGEAMRFQPTQWPPTVDAAIVTWNNWGVLRRSLESLATTDYPRDRFQIFIVDNASKDGTVEAIRQLATTYPFPLHVISSPVNTGCPIGFNWGVGQGQGEIVARLDDDIFVPPNWLGDLVENFRRRPFAGCVGPKFINDDPRAAIQCTEFRHFPNIYGHEDEADAGQANYVARTGHIRGCCNLYRRDVFQRCGLFDPRFSPTQFDDPDHQIAVIGAGYEIIYDGRVRVVHKLTNGVARSHAAISNGAGNHQKMYGKWGHDIFEVIDKSLDLSREGRFLPDDGDTSAYLALGPDREEFPRTTSLTLTRAQKEFCASTNRWLHHLEGDPLHLELIDNHLQLAATTRRDGFSRRALDILHTVLNFAPERPDVMQALADTYREIGNLQSAARLEQTIRRLTGKLDSTTAPAPAPAIAPANNNGASRLHRAYTEIGENRSATVNTAKPKLKVLMVNTYEARVAGGDMMQIKKTKEYLERFGCAVDIDCSPRPDPRGYDVVHVWNLWFPHQTLAQVKAIRVAAPRVPIVLSTIYWDMSEKAWVDGVVPRMFFEAGTEATLVAQLQMLAEDKLVSGGLKRSQHFEPNYPGYEMYQKRILELVDVLLPQSYAEIRNLQKTLGMVRPFAIVRNSAEPRVFETATKDWFIDKYGVKDFVLCVGLVEPRKNQLMLLYALRGTKLPVVIVGRHYDQNYMRLCRRFAPSRTIFIDHLPHELLASAYKAARVHALPSWMECCAFVNVEAALSGCALAVSNKTSEPEYFGGHAYECDPGDVKSIRKAVLAAHANYDRDASKRARLREIFLREYTWDRCVEQTYRSYQWAIEKRATDTIPRPTTSNDGSSRLESWELPNNVYATVSQVEAPRPNRPQVSIVIPVFNQVEYTAKCLEALYQNSGSASAYEVIIVDNGSTDRTRKFLDELSKKRANLKVVSNHTNEGFGRACNQGAARASGEHLLFLNNDTETQTGWLEALLHTLDADKSIGAVGGKLLYPDGTIQHAGVLICHDTKSGDSLQARNACAGERADLTEANVPREFKALTAACLLVRGPAFSQAGHFDEGFWNGYEDIDLCFKLRAHGWKLIYQPASVVTHHESKSGAERFTHVQQNIQRLHQKWQAKVKADIIVRDGGQVEVTPDSILQQGALPELSYQHPTAQPIVSIIILAHNQIEDTKKCLASIESGTPQSHELILVDNASTDGTREFLREYERSHSHVRVIANDTNRGFAAGNNQGLAVARGGHLLLLNNDTIVTDGWLGRMLAVFDKHPEAGMVGPVSNYVSGAQLVQNVPYKGLEQMTPFAARWASDRAGQSQEVHRLVGFCLLARRAVIEQIGGLDERFGSGNFEDDDFCLRAGLVGFTSRVALDAFVHHTGSQTFKGAKIDYRESMLRNWTLFKSKWSLPANAPVEKGYRAPLQLAKNETLVLPLEWQSAGPAAKAVSRQASSVSRIGRLDEARELFFQKRELLPSWNAALATVQARPFHPEAYLLLAQIAKAAGDVALARRCAERGDKMAPKWKPRHFLRSLPGKGRNAALSTSDWPSLPATGEPRLSVCLITRNEEPFLDRCLNSVKPIAHQIVVVDTGSTDRTVEIAKRHGAEVHSFAWCDDFSAARNAALERATGDWVLILDADEELPPSSHAILGKHIREASVMAYRLPIVDAGREDEERNFVPRLFRNAPGIHFVGRVHEQAFSSLEPLRAEWNLENRLGAATLMHHGYAREVSSGRNKSERNLRLLKMAIVEQPDDANVRMNLGLELARSGDLEAGIEEYQKALKILGAQATGQVTPELREALLTQLCAHLTAKRNFAEIVRVLHTPLACTGELTASLHFALGLAFMELKRTAEATGEFRQCLAKRDGPTLSPIHKDVRTAAPHHCLALCLAHLKRDTESEKSFQTALQMEPQSRSLRLDYAMFQSKSGRQVEALKQLHQLVTEKADEAAVWQAGGQIVLSQPEFLEFACDWTSEAVRQFPQDPTILLQRAEALLMTGHVSEALPLWRKAYSPTSPSDVATLVMCEVLADIPSQKLEHAQEAVVSEEFLKCYRRLLNAGASQVVVGLNERLIPLRQVLPTAARVLDEAMLEAREGVAA